MKINWKLRLKNKTTLLSLLACLAAFIYQVLGILGITAPISEEQVTQVFGLIVNLLGAIGIMVDPTTSGTGDSSRALEYKEPN
ncbi:phage holin [Aminipila butyrica]|uniref:Phage holin n=1 Tax=Aminipila butyrica TaxID=433296 RepID=A0A858BUL1_9FIRM|nr:phage holin [Aminipila butyrica]QIB68630.1 phage holin [Aminipila butyrica]